MFGSKLQFPRVTTRFAQDERGGLMVFSLFIMVCMLLAVGISIDVMRTEVMRTRLQSVSDRAVLAAADLEQELSAEEVVRDYFAREGLEAYLTGVTVTETDNAKTVSISASTDVPSMFLNMVGISTLAAPASGTATESVTDVELSLVLDISGSMGSNNKIANLRTAAKEFVDTVIRPETPGAVSISLVPYTAQVNAGPTLMSFLNVTQEHNYSHCINFEDTDFETTSISLVQEYEHTQHFSRYNVPSGTVWNPACPQQEFERITAFSEDAVALKAQLDQFQARAHTSIHLGMKWGTALLDPSFAPVISSMAASGDAGTAFADRPYAYNRPNTLKAVVLMTDGINVRTRKIAPWAYDTEAEREAFHNGSVNQVASAWGVSVNSFLETAYTPATADDMLENICDAAKAQGIIIYTIGFEVTEASAQVMEDCASTPANFYLVDGVEIVDAFASIARQINQLRLTQ